VFRGILVSGGLADLGASDDARLSVRNGIVLNASEAPVTVDLTATAPQTIASSIQVSVEARVSAAGLGQRIQAFDYDANAWVDLDQRSATLADQIVNVTVTTNVSRFIRPSDREIKLRLAYKGTGPVSSATWQADIDLVRWTLSQ
jgi:hypothetical protein